MKIFTVVGIRKSGKTTTVTELIKEFKQRGLRVGTVKNVFCPGFSMDKPDTNTWRHREAGADVILVKAKEEASMLMPGGDIQKLMQGVDCDVLILEGEYELSVPRIVCARRNVSELEERCNARTIAVSGQIAEHLQSYGQLPVYHCIRQAKELADYLLKEVPEAVFPLDLEKVPEHTNSFCQCGCHKTEKKLKEAGTRPVLTASPRHQGMHIFLTGEKQVGKSTLLGQLRQELTKRLGLKEVGYETRTYELQGEKKGYCLHSLTDLAAYENDCPVTIRIGERRMMAVPQTFESLGVKLLKEAQILGRKEPVLLVMDEIGKAEEEAYAFQQQVFACLDEMDYGVGVLQKGGKSFVQAIAKRDDVRLYTVTKENRGELLEKILEDMK